MSYMMRRHPIHTNANVTPAAASGPGIGYGYDACSQGFSKRRAASLHQFVENKDGLSTNLVVDTAGGPHQGKRNSS